MIKQVTGIKKLFLKFFYCNYKKYHYLSAKLAFMTAKKTETRGRKPLPKSKKKVSIRIMVPGKYARQAQSEINIVEAKYCAAS